MDKQTATQLIGNTFNFPFDEGRFRNFAINLLNNVDEAKRFDYISGTYIRHSFKNHITKYKRLGTYTDPNGDKIDVLVVQLKNEWALERSRTMLRNFTSDYLKNRDEKDAALVAYYTTNPDDWRFSYIRMEYIRVQTDSGKFKIKEDITPAKRYSFLVGKNEPNHTAQAQLVGILSDDRKNPTLSELENAFSVDVVTKQFYKDYRAQFEKLWNELNDIVEKDPKIAEEFETKTIDTANFAKKLMGQIVFLYFLQKKGWLGVGKDENGNFKEWGKGPKNFLRRLFDKEFINYGNFFNDVLEPLFYEALATERANDVFTRFNCKIPFLNGGLFEPINDYTWEETDIRIDNDLIGDVLKTFDQYNFTVREDEPLEKEVAVDPEMLGKVFENLLPENLRKGKGAYYTPRTIVHYMCQESLINYLDTECEPAPKEDIETLIREGDIILELETAIVEQGKKYDSVLMDSIKENAQALDDALANIKVCDPAIGSGAFPVGMLTEIVKARTVLSLYLNSPLERGVPQGRGVYNLKRHCIQNSLYGVDIDPGAIEIAKLRLWLSLVVDEDDYTTIQPLPNLDYKIMQGNSLIEEFHGISLDIEKKEENVTQASLLEKDSELDNLIDDLHEKLQKQFNAVHPREKTQSKLDVENAMIDIFHFELKKQKRDYFTALDKMNDTAKTLKGETKETYLKLEKEKIKRRFNDFDVEQVENNLFEMTHGNKIRNFFPWKLYFADVFREKGGFDVSIANPPYIGEQGNKNIFREVKATSFGKSFYKRKMDYFYFFFHKSLDLLKPRGSVSFITTNYYITADGAHKLRLDFKNRVCIQSLINFNELKIFDSAKGQHNMISIIVKENNANFKSNNCVTQRTGTVNDSILNEILSMQDIGTEYYLVKQNNIYDGDNNYMRLSGNDDTENNSSHGTILKKIKIDSIPLIKLKNVNQGVLSGVDKITRRHIEKHNIPEDCLGNGVFVLSDDEIKKMNLNNKEKTIIKSYYKNSDIFRYHTNSVRDKKNLIFATRNLELSSIPNIKKHFINYKQVIKSRSKSRGEMQAALKLGKWWVIFAARMGVNFEGPKIVFPQRSRINTFAYNNEQWYGGSDIYIITDRGNDKIHIKYILPVINSKLFYYWLYFRGKRKGEILELLYKPISEIPIREISFDDQKPFINLVDQILTAKKSNPQADTSALEREIDLLVYALYGLTDEEIQIVEESVNG